MCLTQIDKIYDPPLAEEREAWGAFRDIDGKLIGVCFDQFGRRFDIFIGLSPYPIEQWITALSPILRLFTESDEGEPRDQLYPPGFHKAPDLEALKILASRLTWDGIIYRRVRLRGILVEGKQENCPVWVAREMFIEKEEQ
jgi:hypothetical protein